MKYVFISIIFFVQLTLVSCSETTEETIPVAPSNLSGEVISTTQIDLSWTDNSTNEESFIIERKTDVGTYSMIATVTTNVTNYSDENLTTNTTYYYRLYSSNSIGKSPTYSNEISLTTKSLPVVTTAQISSIDHYSATSGGSVSYDGGSSVTSRGIVWSTNINPVISLPTKTTDGSGVGDFESSLTELNPNTTYYVRAYATNEFGTSYGNELSFSTTQFETFTLVSANYHSLALKSDGTLWAWGDNRYGQLGDGTSGNNKNTPIQIGSGYTSISAGGAHSLALKTDGSLWAWGYNQSGQLGDGTNTSKTTPVQVGSGYSAIAAGSRHSIALKSDGTLWAWGSNFEGELGDGTNVSKNTPIQIGSGFITISAGGGSNFNNGYTLAIKTDGSLWAWGDNEWGQLGLGTNNDINIPTQVGSGYSSISAGQIHSLALMSNGTLWACGYNNYGQVGDGTNEHRNSFVQIGSGYSKISAGQIHSLMLKSDGTLFGCGKNLFGAIGDGTNIDKNTPVQVGTSFSIIAAGGECSLAIKVNGSLWAWGSNVLGQLGDGTNVDKNIPTIH